MSNKYYINCLFIFFTLGLSAQCTDSGNYWNKTWVSCTTSTNPNPIHGNSHWILYEFHEAHVITESHIWNANRIGESGQGAKEVIIDYSEDGLLWQELGQFTIPQADESEDYTGIEGPDFGGIFIQKVLLTFLSSHNDEDCVAIAEVQFGIDSEACYGIIDECGVCDGPGALTWYFDADEDGLGDANTSITDCEQPIGYVADNTDLCDNGALGWDEIRPLFADNGCNGCHNGNAAGGLDLRTYEATSLGGNICGTNLFTGDHFVETIITTAYAGCGTALGIPSMNDRSSGEFDAEELAKLQAWIDGGAPKECADFSFVVDADQDGFFSDVDCDDSNPAINPDAIEIPNNGVDEDCDGSDLMVATHEINNRKISIYPNPVASQVFIQTEGLANYEVRLFDIKGKLLLTKTNARTIRVSEFPSGSYLLEIQDLETYEKITERIIVSK